MAISARAQGGASPGDTPAQSETSLRLCDDCSAIREADHRIANHLSMLSAYLRLKSADLARTPAPSAESVQLLLQSVGAQIDAVAQVHRSLLLHGSAAEADLGQYLHELCAPLATVVGGRLELVENFAPGCVARPEQVLPLGQIVAEVVANAVKHGYGPGQSGRVSVCCVAEPKGRVTLTITDDGAGLPAGFDAATGGGLGLQLIRALSQQMAAQVSFEAANPGLQFRLTWPVAGPD